ncbi:pyruvate dehydrogenase (acetyl-transferring) E1 component subunit alpha [Candidatus Woesearchaeota archaeon]|nr:pyruvate dehydrogenase (acetyl-transferring) E1 component subunit alpha [Candidatus Woesearchaeota archaeon]
MAKKQEENKSDIVSVLDENGKSDEQYLSKISNDKIKEFYKAMVLIRAFDQKAFNMQRQGRIGTYISYKGQEASQAGTALALEDKDFIFPTYRDSGVLLLRKQPIVQILQYWGGDERGLKSPDSVNNFPIAIPVGTQIPHAAGAGWAATIRKSGQVAVGFFGDGATSKGDFHEGLNFASVFNAATIFLCQNNQYAISVPRAKQTKSESISKKAVAYGMEGIEVDGNDIFAVYKAVKEAADKARKGNGPTLIECYTYRISDHSTSDDASRYRSKSEVEQWEKKDPIARVEKYMQRRGIKIDKDAILEEAKAKIEKEIEAFEKISAPDPKDMFKYVFAEMTPAQNKQMKDLLGE